MDDPLPLKIRMGIRFHLMMCRFCRNYRKQLLIISRAIQTSDARYASGDFSRRLPDPVRQKLKDLLRDHDPS